MSHYQPPSSPLPPGQQPQWGQQSSQPLSQQGYPQQSYQQPQWQGLPQYSQPGAFQQPKKRRHWPWILASIAVMAFLVGAVSTFSVGAISTFSGNYHTSTTLDTTQTTQPARQNTQVSTQPSAKPTQKPQPIFANFGDGIFQVGKDIQPGIYRTHVGSSNCYYARLKGFSGSLDDILANDNTDAPAIVTIKSSDKGFESQNCGTWTKDLSQITTGKTSFGDGMFLIGTDITPGTYRDTGGDNCYYARLSGFSGDISDILANNNVSAPTIVTISSSDKGFKSQGCGTWKKI